MRRIFSGNRSGASSPKLPKNNRSSSSSSLTLTQVAMGNSSDEISPELSPIITLLSAQSHRRYNEGVFMILQSINSDGEPVQNRQWREVYGVLLGTQLAIWNVEELAKFQNDTEALLNASSKPDYINFTDSSFRAVEKLDNGLSNVIIVSTTLKNQYLLQYAQLEDFHRWGAAFRLTCFEYTSLQEAYTGALLSARGSKLSDIRVILSETKFDYEDWVSVRFGSGMPWKRCFAVIEQPQKKSKAGKIRKGTVSFYKDEKKQKKTAMAIIKDASAAYALYPQSHQLIDHSTMIKLEGTVFFDSKKKSIPKEASVYFMPEQHSAVPGYDTLIRFLIPLLNTFALYGRPKRLNANKAEMNSLLFGLPVLPHVHYLEVDDLILLASNSQSSNWLVTEWREQIKEVLGRKVSTGYTGCGSSYGITGALNSPALASSDFLDVKSAAGAGARPLSPLSPSFFPAPKFNRDSVVSKASSLNTNSADESEGISASPAVNENPNRNSEITQLYEDYSKIPRDNIGYDGSSSGRGVLDTGKPLPPTKFSESQNSLPDYGSDYRLEAQSTKTTKSSDYNSFDYNPYDEFKKSNKDYNDDNFDDDEIFQKGLSALSVNSDTNSKKLVKENIFDPDFANDNLSFDAEPQLKVQTPSKALPTPANKISQGSPYTSGRVSSNPSSKSNLAIDIAKANSQEETYSQLPATTKYDLPSIPNEGGRGNTTFRKSPAQIFNQPVGSAPTSNPYDAYRQQFQPETQVQRSNYQSAPSQIANKQLRSAPAQQNPVTNGQYQNSYGQEPFQNTSSQRAGPQDQYQQTISHPQQPYMSSSPYNKHPPPSQQRNAQPLQQGQQRGYPSSRPGYSRQPVQQQHNLPMKGYPPQPQSQGGYLQQGRPQPGHPPQGATHPQRPLPFNGPHGGPQQQPLGNYPPSQPRPYAQNAPRQPYENSGNYPRINNVGGYPNDTGMIKPGRNVNPYIRQ